MTEDYAIQVSFTLPPKAQYEKGAMLNVRATGTGQLAMFLEELVTLSETDRPAGAVVKQFLDHFGAGAGATQHGRAARAPASKATPVEPPSNPDDSHLTPAEIAEALGASIVDDPGHDVPGDDDHPVSTTPPSQPPTDIQLAVAKQFGIDPTSHTRTSIAAAIKEAKGRKK